MPPPSSSPLNWKFTSRERKKCTSPQIKRRSAIVCCTSSKFSSKCLCAAAAAALYFVITRSLFFLFLIKFIQALSQLWVPELVLPEPERDYLLPALLLLLFSHFIVSCCICQIGCQSLPSAMTDSSSSAFSAAAYHSLSLCLFTTSPPLIIAHFSVLAAEQKIYRSVGCCLSAWSTISS